MTKVSRLGVEALEKQLFPLLQISDDFVRLARNYNFRHDLISLDSTNCNRWHELNSDDYRTFKEAVLKNTQLRHRVIFLASIDLDIPRANSGGDFVTSLLSVVDDSLRSFGWKSQSHYAPEVLPYDNNDLLIELRRFETDMCVAQMGNFDQLAARSPHYDSDAYATERVRKSRAVIRIRERLAALLANYSSFVNGRFLDNDCLQTPILIATFTNAEISSNPQEMLLLYKNMKFLNVPNLLCISINDLNDGDLEDMLYPQRKLTSTELRAKLDKKPIMD
jgi:hypothetical protein